MASDSTHSLSSIVVEPDPEESGPYFNNLEIRNLHALQAPKNITPSKDLALGGPVYVLDADSTEGAVQQKPFHNTSELPLKMSQPLRLGIKARLILLPCVNPENICYKDVAAMGKHFGIDPQFFNRNFGYGRGSFLQRLVNYGVKEPTLPLAIRKVSFELRSYPRTLRCLPREYGIALSAMLLTPANSSYNGECPIA